MPCQVAATGPDPAEPACCFGKRTRARIRTIGGFLDTLAALGKFLLGIRIE